METEAYQPLAEPVHLSGFGALLVELVSKDSLAATATLELVRTADVQKLSTVAFGSMARKREVLRFPLPPGPDQAVTALRVFFRGHPDVEDESLRVAVERFTLVPR